MEKFQATFSVQWQLTHLCWKFLLYLITTKPNHKCKSTYLKINDINDTQNFLATLRSFCFQVIQRRNNGSFTLVSANQNSIVLFHFIVAHSSAHMWANWFILKSNTKYNDLHKRYEVQHQYLCSIINKASQKNGGQPP